MKIYVLFNFGSVKLNKMNLGVDGYKNGWCCCSIENNISFSTHQNIQSIIELYPNFDKIFIDIPIGLSSTNNKRLIDEKLRKHLPKGKKSSVFNAPSRTAVNCKDYNEAKTKEIKISGKSISIQSWNISNKINEIDKFLKCNPKQVEKIHESHPELCFYDLNNKKALEFNKKNINGFKERIDILKNYIEDVYELSEKFYFLSKKKGIKKDDILDATSLALSAKLWKKNGKRIITQTISKDEHNIPFGIYY
tara:strand:- start:1723 stop:2472 length:750 start_codon:yes stop_codon:yes gene_type:complete